MTVVRVMPFPVPPESVVEAAYLVNVQGRGDPNEMNDRGISDMSTLPRPWDPATCPRDLQADVWQWCEEVSQWINHEFAWRPQQMIPACWPEHPHIAHELVVLATLRWAAGDALSPEPLEEWHRYTLPSFLDRLAARLGESGCRTTGQHTSWPAGVRYETQQKLPPA